MHLNLVDDYEGKDKFNEAVTALQPVKKKRKGPSGVETQYTRTFYQACCRALCASADQDASQPRFPLYLPGIHPQQVSTVHPSKLSMYMSGHYDDPSTSTVPLDPHKMQKQNLQEISDAILAESESESNLPTQKQLFEEAKQRSLYAFLAAKGYISIPEASDEFNRAASKLLHERGPDFE